MLYGPCLRTALAMAQYLPALMYRTGTLPCCAGSCRALKDSVVLEQALCWYFGSTPRSHSAESLSSFKSWLSSHRCLMQSSAQAFARQRRLALAEVQERAGLLTESVQALEHGMCKSEQHVLHANQDTFVRIQREFKVITRGLLPGLVSCPVSASWLHHLLLTFIQLAWIIQFTIWNLRSHNSVEGRD